MLTRERFIEEVKDAGLDWQRGFVVSDDSNRYEDLCRAIEALVRAECVPPGYVVVPAEPTDAMLDAAESALRPVRRDCVGAQARDLRHACRFSQDRAGLLHRAC